MRKPSDGTSTNEHTMRVQLHLQAPMQAQSEENNTVTRSSLHSPRYRRILVMLHPNTVKTHMSPARCLLEGVFYDNGRCQAFVPNLGNFTFLDVNVSLHQAEQRGLEYELPYAGALYRLRVLPLPTRNRKRDSSLSLPEQYILHQLCDCCALIGSRYRLRFS